MSSYVLRLCPVCKLEILEKDEIKVCMDCGVAHHKLCWEKNKGCGNDVCTGKMKKTPEVPKTAARIFCGKCGKELRPGQEFCPGCGTARPGAPVKEAAKAAKKVTKENSTKTVAKAAAVPAAAQKSDTPPAAASAVAPAAAPAAPKKRFCGKCGAELKPGQKFCGGCGQLVS